MAAFIKSQTTANSGLWVTLDNGAQSTESRALIKKALQYLRKKRELVTLIHKGYQSPKTVIVSFNDQELEIDKPLDWPGTQKIVNILFKDETLVWNQVRVQVLRVTDNSIITQFPSNLVRLQRRANYRVDVPNGSTAMFMHKDEMFQGFQVVDVSANGVLVCADKYCEVRPGDKIDQISLFFPGMGTGLSAGTYINIRQGKVMRTARDDNKKFCYGIHFDLTQNEEETLLQYVRQRERELLRKGLSE